MGQERGVGAGPGHLRPLMDPVYNTAILRPADSAAGLTQPPQEGANPWWR